MAHPQFILRLRALRKTIRRRLLAYGFCAVVSGGVVAFLTVVALDWLLWLPSWLRLVGLVLFFLGMVGAVLHWIVRPLRTPLGLEQIAARLEKHFGALGDRLVSTVNFIEQGTASSSTLPVSRNMVEEVVRNTERVTKDLSFEQTLSLGPLARRGGLLALSVIVLSSVFIVAPVWPMTGLYRYLYPWGQIEWPRRVALVPLTGAQTAAVGESVTVRMRILRGLSPSLRPVVRLRESDPATRREPLALAMRRDTSSPARNPQHREGGATQDLPDMPQSSEPLRQADFYAVIDAVTQDLTYWFEAGDATTARFPYTIHVVRRPQTIEALAVIDPPSYAANLRTRVADLAAGAVNAPIGGHVTVVLTVSKTLGSQALRDSDPLAKRRLGLRTDTGAFIPLVVSATNPRELRARFPVVSDVRFRPELTDEAGFANRGAAEYEIHAVPDAPPRVTVLQPTSVTQRTPVGWIPMVLQAEDDFGVNSLDLYVRREGDPLTAESRIPLTAHLESPSPEPVAPQPEPPPALHDNTPAPQSGVGHAETVAEASDFERLISDGPSSTKRVARFTFRLPSLSNSTGIGPLSPGDVLVARAEATDNRRRDDESGQSNSSSPFRIVIISEAEFNVRLRTELSQWAERIRHTALDQQALHDQALALVDEEAGDRPRKSLAVSDLGRLAAQQSRLGRRLHDASDAVTALAQRVEQNLTQEVETRDRLAAAGASLQEVAGGPVVNASTALVEAQSRLADPAAQRAAVRQAAEWQNAISQRLDSLLRTLSVWGSFQELIAKTQDLLDRQNALRRETVRIGKTLLGKALEALTDAESSQLKRTQRRQEQLATDLEQLVSGMAQQGAALKREDPAGAQAIDAALRVARAYELLRHARDATVNVGVNRTVAASIAQKSAAEAIRRMTSALRERDARVLEELRKHLSSALESLRELITAQRTLRDASHEAGLMGLAADSATMLSDEQRRIARNTNAVGNDLADPGRRVGALGLGLSLRPSDLTPAVERLRQAADSMDRAEAVMRQLDAEPAVAAQDTALALLEEALAVLRELADRVEQEALLRSLEQIQQDLEEILAAQREVNAGIGELLDAVRARDRITRQEARAASKLAYQQADVRRMVEAHAPDLQKVVVYEWALRRVMEWMTESRSRLSQRRIDDDLLRLAERIIHQLEQLIEAIVQTRNLPVDEAFVESADVRPGQGESLSSGPIPTVAELLVLKSMQTDINERTQRLHESGVLDEPSEEKLLELRALGEDQRGVRQLTEMVTTQARHP